ncbi:hypothetical protein OR1_04200 [Geobacter sp. OR-1]|uniref:restriction endonuclease n=1 Tax=Geobacter sp. OR-1 TaxID=1266765 RepID=UPI0005435B1F|nr:hypothetical protein [Geobacter sp. OR-1]GAM11876.1 hypothetical protein OR1_04200 [Geobacter sp. OR-1]
MTDEFHVAIYQNGYSILGIGEGITSHEAIQEAIVDAKSNFPVDGLDLNADSIEVDIGDCGVIGKTKSTTDKDGLRDSERKKVECGEKHFSTIGVDFKVVKNLKEALAISST